MPKTTNTPAELHDLLANVPHHLAERASLVGGGGPGGGAAFVLYWAHHALRADENPALDLAGELATRLQLPLLVFSGLGGMHPRLSDRHATFLLEGMRDFSRQLARLGVPYAASLDVVAPSDSVIDRLAARAHLIVTEDFPSTPFPDRIASIARRSGRTVVAVDTACVVPMNRVDGVFDRAFAFRDATERERAARVDLVWPTRSWQGKCWPFVDHGLPELDWNTLSISDSVASLEIDHSVAPVVDTVGGTEAGLARWNEFRATRLADYARDRNDAAVPGVSRMSAYLHFGMVSPMRLAREAHAVGATKYLEELLVWRELAYQWCRHSPDHESVHAIPLWARRTLQEHASDQRAVLSWEQLASGRTGDRLWDLAQRSLVVHGELHNNVRMTWGKSIVGWTNSPESALATLIDLNHRFALDGADPASTGGLLWCLGLFDRPFLPKTPVFGSIRPRSTTEHAARLDIDTFAQRVSRRSYPLRVAVIGAGIAGTACARTLAEHRVDVTVFEKSRGVGGRMSTRRGDAGAFDHGAQYFTARDPRFAHWIESWSSDGVVARWHGRFAEVGAHGVTSLEGVQRFVALPGMSSLCAHIAQGVDVVVNTRIESMTRGSTGWILRGTGADGSTRECGEFDVVLSTAPAPQTAALLGSCAPGLAAIASRSPMRAMWSMMLASHVRIDFPFDHAEILSGTSEVGGTLAWLSRVSSKPGRACDGVDRWVVLGRGEWSEERLERTPAAVAVEMVAAMRALGHSFGIAIPEPMHAIAHRFRFALASREVGVGSAFDAHTAIGIAGDWMSGTRVEDAFLSGVGLAGRVLGSFAERNQRAVLTLAELERDVVRA